MGEIQTEITRIDNNIKNALAKVAAKGVTVAADANSDDLPGLIESISTAEDLTAVLDEQEAIITELEAALEGKAGGGTASVDTCTVKITCFQAIGVYLATAYVDGAYVPLHANKAVGESETALTLENVVCGSYILINHEHDFPGYTLGGGVTQVSTNYARTAVFQAPTEAGATGTIDIYDND